MILFLFSPSILFALVYAHQVIARTQIMQDDPLVLNYGFLNNDFFLLDYGFVMNPNPYDCVELKYDPALLDAASMAAGISSPNFSSPSSWQQEILFQLNLCGEHSDHKVCVFLCLQFSFFNLTSSKVIAFCVCTSIFLVTFPSRFIISISRCFCYYIFEILEEIHYGS